MCNQQVYNTWTLDSSILFELCHLGDVGVLRNSELKILVDTLEKGALTYHWLPFLPNIIKDNLPKLQDFKNIIYSFIRAIQLCKKELYIKLYIICRKILV
jgi:hypothetical protein